MKTNITLLSRLFTDIQRFIISRLHWGRGSAYKNVIHLIMLLITIVIAVSGVVSRIAVADSNILTGGNTYGSNDLLSQGASIQAVLTSTGGGISSITHVVESGETLQSIADKYIVTKDTIRWYNPDIISPFSDDIDVGFTLKIPASSEGKSINGVLYTVKEGESLSDIIAHTSSNNKESNEFNIAEFNELTAPYNLKAGQQLFIPDRNLNVDDIVIAGIPTGIFTNPLADSSCSGYSVSRGFAFYHNGLDLARWPGCTIESVASGVVEYVGCIKVAEGCHIKINHGGGIVTHYYHGSGAFYVKVGDRVQQGQSIMEMGTTGNSTGVHLHFSLLKDGVFVNPDPYVPY